MLQPTTNELRHRQGHWLVLHRSTAFDLQNQRRVRQPLRTITLRHSPICNATTSDIRSQVLQCLGARAGLVCHAADTASLVAWFLFGKLLGVATLVGFGGFSLLITYHQIADLFAGRAPIARFNGR